MTPPEELRRSALLYAKVISSTKVDRGSLGPPDDDEEADRMLRAGATELLHQAALRFARESGNREGGSDG